MSQEQAKSLFRDKKIYQVVNPRLVQSPSDISVGEAVNIMQTRKSGYIILADHGNVQGIFTEVDLVNKILGQNVNWSRPVSEFMTRNPFALNLNDSVANAIKLMGEHNFYHIPLVDEDKKLVNVLSVRSLIRFLSEFYPLEIYNLPPSPDQIVESREGG